MSATESEFDNSLWGGPETNENAPKRCPICDRALAHPDDLRDNDNIRAQGLFRAYREHRQAHYSWGKDPREDGKRYGDPYLGNYYDGDKDATYEPGEDEPAGDPDEIVGHVFDVTISYESRASARVVAPNESQAKEKAKRLRLNGNEDVTGAVPEAHITHEVHTDTRDIQDVTRSDTDLAERMEGWPW